MSKLDWSDPSDPQHPHLLTTLVRGAGLALAIQIVSLGIIYASQILLARWMGVIEYGVYDLAIALSLALSLIAGFGVPNAILRFIPEYRVKQDWGHLRGILRGSWQQTWITSVLLAIISTLILLGVALHQPLAYLPALMLGVWMMPLMASMTLQQQIARGFESILLAYAPSLIFYPLLLTAIAFLWHTYHPLISTTALVLSSIAMALILIVQSVIIHREHTPTIRYTPPAFAFRYWWKVALPLIVFDGSYLILNQSDTLMLGAMLGPKAVGVYSAALKTSLWVHFILSSVNAISAPLIASLYAQGDRQGLQQLVSTIARWMFYPAMAIAVGLIGFADPILRLFGNEFTAAKPALILLILGQLVNVGAGSVGYLLMMTGYQVESARVMGVSALVNIILNGFGIHWLGVTGAALATALSMALWNVWLHSIVVKRLQVYPSILATFR